VLKQYPEKEEEKKNLRPLHIPWPCRSHWINQDHYLIQKCKFHLIQTFLYIVFLADLSVLQHQLQVLPLFLVTKNLQQV
jgi:hypothetical protein